MKIKFNCVGFIDRRSVSLHQQNDALIEKRWRERVAQHPVERARLEREDRRNRPAFLLVQGE